MRRSIVVALLGMMFMLVMSEASSQGTTPPTAVPQGTGAETKYVPLTREEAEKWMRAAETEEILDFIIKYDEVEHSKLMFDSFDYVCIISGQTVMVVPVSPQIRVRLASLGYKVSLPVMEFKDVVPKAEDNFWKGFGIGAGVGGAVGIGLTTLIVLIVGGVIH